MTTDYSGAYFVGNLIIITVWLMLFIRRKDLRAEMLTMGFIILAFLGTSIFFLNKYLIDYWHPEYLGILKLSGLFEKLGLMIKGTEDIVFIFALSGIAAILYEELLGKKHLKKGRDRSLKFLIIFPIIMFLCYLAVTIYGKVNIIYGDFLAYGTCSAIVLLKRRDLIKHALISGVFMGVFFLIFLLIFTRIYPGIIDTWWILNKTSGIFLLGIPLEEILWAFFVGLWAGPTYEFILGLKDK